MDQTANARCWNCKEVFQIVLRRGGYKGTNTVLKLVPCPYCGRQCKIEVYEQDAGSAGTVMRLETPGGPERSSAGIFERPEPGAPSDEVLPSRPGENAENAPPGKPGKPGGTRR